MKTPLLQRPPFNLSRRHRAFSLVEVTLALGIITFGLVGVVGVLPAAMNSGRQSFDQNRAAAIANTLFASFRSQPFDQVGYVDEQFKSDGFTPDPTSQVPALNLNSTTQACVPVDPNDTSPSSKVQFYASFLDAPADTTSGDAYGTQRRLSFTTARPYTGKSYLVTLVFNNAPDGMTIQPPASNQASTPPAQANEINLIVSPADQPNPLANSVKAEVAARVDQYRFVSTVVNRTN